MYIKIHAAAVHIHIQFIEPIDQSTCTIVSLKSL